MIPFNSLGHSYNVSSADEPLYWVDASDNNSFTIDGSNNVTQLINKGTESGVFGINGQPKFLNGGFENTNGGNYFTRDLGVQFVGHNSFTFVTTYDFQLNSSSYHWFSEMYGINNNNRLAMHSISAKQTAFVKAQGSDYSNQSLNTFLGLKTQIITYDISSKTLTTLNSDGDIITSNNVEFDSVGANSLIQLLQYKVVPTIYSGANNPLHEFRLYDRAFTNLELTDLQNELTKKWGKMLYHVDASDTNSFTTDGSNNVLSLNNLGTEGGTFNVVGTPKYLNGGFESHSASDYFTRDLGEPFLPTKSFTVAVTFDLQDITSGVNTTRNWFVNLLGDTSNLLVQYKTGSALGNALQGSSVGYDDFITYTLGLHTLIISYDLPTQTLKLTNDGGVTTTFTNVVFNNTQNAVLQLLSAFGYSNSNSGANNPLHEFRLYDYAMNNTQLTELQNQLNLKWQ